MSRRWALWERVPAPDVDEPERDQMVRWRLIQTPWFGICVHRINTADHARPIPHTHPWPFVSLVVAGGYTEELERRDRVGRLRRRRAWLRRVGSLRFMRAADAHTITGLRRSPTWTVVVVGRLRPAPSWGYWDNYVFTPWNEHPYAERFAAALAARKTIETRSST
jgi:hypothetical protein